MFIQYSLKIQRIVIELLLNIDVNILSMNIG
jgi:hypothetical protein